MMQSLRVSITAAIELNPTLSTEREPGGARAVAAPWPEAAPSSRPTAAATLPPWLENV